MNEIIIRLNDNKKVTSVSVDGEVIMKPSEKGNVYHEVKFKGYDFEGIDSTLKVVETELY